MCRLMQTMMGLIRLFGGVRQSNSQYEQIHFPNSGKNQPGSSIGPALGCAETKQSTQQYSQIEPGNLDNVALLSILDSPEKAAPHTAPVKAMGKTAFHPLAPRPQKRLALFGFQPGTVPPHRFPRFSIPMLAQLSLVRHQIKGVINAGCFFLLPDRTAWPGRRQVWWCRPDPQGVSPRKQPLQTPDRPHARACTPYGCGHP